MGEWIYFVSWSEIAGKQGNCLFRTRSLTPLGPWLALKNGTFDQRYMDPYRENTVEESCDFIGMKNLRGVLRSIIWIEKINRFVGVFSYTGKEPGIYYSFSSNLIDWSAPELLRQAMPWYGQHDCGTFYDYPSLIDHSSSSPEFSSGGDDLYLYMTRYNWQTCSFGLDRDLVRVKVSVESLVGRSPSR
jgi:hypothetical protein